MILCKFLAIPLCVVTFYGWICFCFLPFLLVKTPPKTYLNINMLKQQNISLGFFNVTFSPKYLRIWYKSCNFATHLEMVTHLKCESELTQSHVLLTLFGLLNNQVNGIELNCKRSNFCNFCPILFLRFSGLIKCG